VYGFQNNIQFPGKIKRHIRSDNQVCLVFYQEVVLTINVSTIPNICGPFTALSVFGGSTAYFTPI
jgi:hypothetical protein